MKCSDAEHSLVSVSGCSWSPSSQPVLELRKYFAMGENYLHEMWKSHILETG